MNFLANLVFLNPWILSGLAALPVLWWLLRITPPAPRLIVLPTTRFLAGLIPEQQTPSHTPWWILLLRLLIAALVLLALAGPVYNPAAQITHSGPLRLVIDNGWAAAQNWDAQIKTALETLAEAKREDREIYILTTAPAAGEEKPAQQGPFSATQAESMIRGLEPLPWPADYKKAVEAVKENKLSIYSLWFSHGLDEGYFDQLAKELESRGGLNLFTPRTEQLPVLLRTPSTTEAGKLQMVATGPDQIPPGRPVTLQALDESGQVLDQKEMSLKPGAATLFTLDTPETLRGQIAQFRLLNVPGVGGVYTLDERYKKKSVALIGPSEDTDPKPFVEARYYLRRAVEPFSFLSEGTAEEVLKSNPSVIILPDILTLSPDTLDALEKWVRSGGLLLRFAGPNMAQNHGQSFLTPVPLRGGGRSLDGSLSWEKPQKIAPFTETSPLYGISLHEDVIVRRQLLAEPVPDLEDKTWAKLEDGTPLITASNLDKGMLVMIHTSADAAWSDLPLSGVFVDILKRIVSLSGHAQNLQNLTGGTLEAQQVFDGFGRLQKPSGTVQSIRAEEFESTMPSSKHPPGIYGHEGQSRVFNLGDRMKSLQAADISGFAHQPYGGSHELDLMPYVLYAALALLLLDWFIMLLLAGGMKPLFRFAGIALVLVSITPAQATEETNLKYADGLYLAYMQSGDPVLDSLSQKGLENLALILKRRTSVEPDGVVPLNPESDTLIFFPFIYWAVSPMQGDLSETAIANIQHYLDHGGTILFDTRDGGTGENSRLRAVTEKLSIPALAPITKDHVLLRAFYLLPSFPGRLTDGMLWVETQSVTGRDNVSSIILGTNDWAGAWAEGSPGLAGSTRQQELAYRFGVNVTMYALTGNYKADQVHVKNILERLGQ